MKKGSSTRLSKQAVKLSSWWKILLLIIILVIGVGAVSRRDTSPVSTVFQMHGIKPSSMQAMVNGELKEVLGGRNGETPQGGEAIVVSWDDSLLTVEIRGEHFVNPGVFNVSNVLTIQYTLGNESYNIVAGNIEFQPLNHLIVRGTDGNGHKIYVDIEIYNDPGYDNHASPIIQPTPTPALGLA